MRMTVTTSKGLTYEVDWMWGPVGANRSLMLQLRDTRPLSEIAADFENCEHFHRASETEGDLDFDGYTQLAGITRVRNGEPDAVQLTMEKPK